MPDRTWLVEYLHDAVVDLESLTSRKERSSLFSVVDKLEALGPLLCSPHMKSLKSEANLMELRPRSGHSPVRAVYARTGDEYVILAVACRKDDFDSAVSRARARLLKRSALPRR